MARSVSPFAQRVDRAAGGIYSPSGTAKQLRMSEGRLRGILADTAVATPEEQWKIALTFGVDPRWLIRGIVSPTAVAALAVFDREHRKALKQIPADKLWIFARYRDALEVMPQATIGTGICRYCACTHYTPCELGCAWVDREQTICDACLWPPGINP